MKEPPPEIFLVDANVFIAPYNTFYPFDLAPGYWTFLGHKIEEDAIQVLDKVREEISKGLELKEWLDRLDVSFIDHRDSVIWENYKDILDHLQNSGLYKDSALAEWSKNNVADPWLIATAMARGRTVVTFEQSNHSLGTNLAKGAKVPDVCKQFNVPCVDIYSMLRKLGFTFG